MHFTDYDKVTGGGNIGQGHSAYWKSILTTFTEYNLAFPAINAVGKHTYVMKCRSRSPGQFRGQFLCKV